MHRMLNLIGLFIEMPCSWKTLWLSLHYVKVTLQISDLPPLPMSFKLTPVNLKYICPLFFPYYLKYCTSFEAPNQSTHQSKPHCTVFQSLKYLLIKCYCYYFCTIKSSNKIYFGKFHDISYVYIINVYIFIYLKHLF